MASRGSSTSISTWSATLALAFGLAFAVLSLLPSCSSRCLRNSDCAQGLICGETAQCESRDADMAPDLHTPDLRPEPDLSSHDGLVVDQTPTG